MQSLKRVNSVTQRYMNIRRENLIYVLCSRSHKDGDHLDYGLPGNVLSLGDFSVDEALLIGRESSNQD